MHAVLAVIAALVRRATTREGGQVISPMVSGGLRACAEQIVEASAYGHVRGRDGNRSPDAAPQGLYLAADIDAEGRRDRWVAISATTDEQWSALTDALGGPGWAADPQLRTAAGRRLAADLLDEHLGAWCAGRHAQAIADLLLAHGVPSAVALMPHEATAVEQFAARGFFATVRHPLLGDIVVSGYPATSEIVGPWSHRPAPILGEHNGEVLRDVAGLTTAELERLAAAGIVGGTPAGLSNFTA
jgi:crotonobetainyl-CoA:carnitine CoA-transferase CaiB-like acyl-CoA transferase